MGACMHAQRRPLPWQAQRLQRQNLYFCTSEASNLSTWRQQVGVCAATAAAMLMLGTSLLRVQFATCTNCARTTTHTSRMSLTARFSGPAPASLTTLLLSPSVPLHFLLLHLVDYQPRRESAKAFKRNATFSQRPRYHYICHCIHQYIYSIMNPQRERERVERERARACARTTPPCPQNEGDAPSFSIKSLPAPEYR